VDPLGALPKLEHLSLLGNPVTTVTNYRSSRFAMPMISVYPFRQYMVHLCPRLKVLDFTKVKQKVRHTLSLFDALHANRKEINLKRRIYSIQIKMLSWPTMLRAEEN